MPFQQVFDVLLGSTATGVVTWLGTLAGLFGIYLTYQQARAARQSAEAARAAVRDFQTKISLNNVGYIASQLHLLADLIRSDNLVAAQIVFRFVKKGLYEIFYSMSAKDELKSKVATAKHALSTVEKQIELGARRAASYKADVAIRAVNGLSDFATERGAEVGLP